MIDVSRLPYRSVLPCRSVAKKQLGKSHPFTNILYCESPASRTRRPWSNAGLQIGGAVNFIRESESAAPQADGSRISNDTSRRRSRIRWYL